MRPRLMRRLGRYLMQLTRRRPRVMRVERGVVTIERRAIGTDDFLVAAHVEKYMRMIERRLGAHAHEFLRADLDDRDAGVVVEMWDDVIRHICDPGIICPVAGTMWNLNCPVRRFLVRSAGICHSATVISAYLS